MRSACRVWRAWWFPLFVRGRTVRSLCVDGRFGGTCPVRDGGRRGRGRESSTGMTNVVAIGPSDDWPTTVSEVVLTGATSEHEHTREARCPQRRHRRRRRRLFPRRTRPPLGGRGGEVPAPSAAAGPCDQ